MSQRCPDAATLILPLLALLLGGCGGLPDGSERGSQPAEVRQRMGATEIAVIYNRPPARGRALFGRSPAAPDLASAM